MGTIGQYDILILDVADVPMVDSSASMAIEDVINQARQRGLPAYFVGLTPRVSAILDQIGAEEVPHVAAGVRWFEFICKRRGVLSVPTFHDIVTSQYKGRIKPPFNVAARTAAGMSKKYYQPETP